MAVLVAEQLLQGGGCGSVAIITPFRNQVELLRRQRLPHGAEVYTIDQAQGKDVDAAVISLAKHTGDAVGELIRTPQRINVAFTRAKKKEVCLGAFASVFSQIPEWGPILQWAQARRAVCAPQQMG
eukprot:TRINITY_DN10065_c1_g1_i1.p4 TRINITY_DN10065_c1_g1~~TRINITY_DN10065_c1_g1_i1.p4  ORF type:complete len:133 (+),score=63.48 TRINITY_DN10065_c1_g1_i1:24-401(+)